MTTPRNERICRYNVTCDNYTCKMYKKVIGRSDCNIACSICGKRGSHHTQKCKALPNGEIRCICSVRRKWIGQKNYSDRWLDKHKRRKEKEMLKRNKGKKTRKQLLIR